ncbi:MAG TPA: RAMP superfamily CRISPR-associated protein [Hydrogenophilus thermoluteolus]|nr:RAMP superfamily CRISPR-associated protein [Hydrogenophilus thermoluteolus]
MKFLAASIEILEDLHIGTGTGLGDIDALQVRDRHGLPVIPASHIKGLLRDVAREWNRLEPKSLPTEKIEHLFGRSGDVQGCLQLTSAYLQAGTEMDPIVWGSTAIDDTGKAAEYSLHFIEYIPAGSSFNLQMVLSSDDENDEALLKAIIARCSRLGGGRNRGHGRIRWHLEPLPEPVPLCLQKAPELPARLRLLLRNLDPICLARTGHPGNLIPTESFIRGRAVRGAFVATCLKLGRTSSAQYLLSETLSWGDALPLPEENLGNATLEKIEVLPIPLSIGTRKAAAPSVELPGWVYHRKDDLFGARDEIDQIMLDENDRPKEKLKRPANGEFLFRPDPLAPWRRYRPQILERLHTRVPNAENNYEQALFSTEELAERTLFLADLIVTTPEQADTLSAILPELSGHWLRIGRGGRPLTIEAAAWLPLTTHGAATNSSFILLLESDLIVRNAAGNFHERLDANALIELAGFSPDEIEIKIDKTFSESCDLFGFNAVTGLPRLAQRAIKAGSVARVSGRDAQRLRQALAQRLTLGECPEEGFGRFRLDRQPQPQQTQNQPILLSKKASPLDEICAEAKRLADKFAHNLLSPSNSQWGDLRSRILSARSIEEIKAALSLIETAKDKHGGKAWEAIVDNIRCLREEITKRPFSEAQTLLEYFFRWQRVRANQLERCR